MLYFFIGLLAFGVLITHIMSFKWFQTNYENNYHKVIDLWLKDPFEQLYLKDINQECLLDIFNLQFQYPGNSGLCTCVLDETQYGQNTNKVNNSNNNHHQRILQVYIDDCTKISCNSIQVSKQVIKPINSVNLNYFFINQANNAAEKLCGLRIPRYSFALKAPLQNQCESYEKYCDFNTTNKDTFDLDQGYCIPKDKECQIQGVNLGGYTQSVVDQLPIVDISISTKQKIEAYNVNVYSTIYAKTLLNMNNITYDSHYQNFLTEQFQINISHMPRVKLRCRQELQQNLKYYIGPESTFKISLVLLIFSVLSWIINFFYAGIGDLFDMNLCLSNCKEYFEEKRVQKKYSTFKNFLIILKPILLIIIMILNGVMIICYVNMVLYMEYMINDKCLDQQINQAVNYNTTAQSGFYQEGLTYVGLMLAGIQLLFDQMFYLSIKNVLLYIFSKMKCKKSLKKSTKVQIETVTITNLNQENQKQNNQNNVAPPKLNDQAEVLKITPIAPQEPFNMDIFADKCKKEETKNFEKQKTESSKLKYTNCSISKYQDDGQNIFLTPVFILGKSTYKMQNDIENNLQQNQLISLDNQQGILPSSQPKYKDQYNDIEDKKNIDDIKQYKNRRQSEILQPPEAPLPPEQSEKSQFSTLNLDKI
ncbi:transmembrane protein, putative (macronuclear) [Tetrahymena thermophila SB210]|uniref:Transmembrane protein, putative n=1 Tax=Tetrahymena thermophila (strain SB210) TaxID=312017 RepID=Q22U95_TETTS|nr:transmembrane protein, putative [Tetrahymena thermophila SB210]EAR88792.1 transmembrane protein, putative [Tetrahymena thermophila SB210]|eukprot:XP_001009037.1 transmembrane protein, putative [Tetrahymena thermophila SB210]